MNILKISRATLGMVVFFCAAQNALRADTIVTAQLTAVSSVSDGSNFVLPYELTIDGTTKIVADCYDLADQVTIGQTWTAHEYSLAEVLAKGEFASNPGALEKYETIAYLASQSANTPDNQIALQHAIWNVFSPSTFPASPAMSAYTAALPQALASFDYSRIVFLEDVNTANAAQSFVLQRPLAAAATPEPATIGLMGIAFLLAAGMRRSKSRNVR